MMARWGEDRRRALRQALGPAIGVQALLLGLFVAHLVPPVPLSVRSLGVWHAWSARARVQAQPASALALGGALAQGRAGVPRPSGRPGLRLHPRVRPARLPGPGPRPLGEVEACAAGVEPERRDPAPHRRRPRGGLRRVRLQAELEPRGVAGPVETEDGRELAAPASRSSPTPAPTSGSSTCSGTELIRRGALTPTRRGRAMASSGAAAAAS